MKAIHTISIDKKKAEYWLEPTKNRKFIRFICPAARINQEFALDDIPALLQDLPTLIQEEFAHDLTRKKTLRFRATELEQTLIEKRASKMGCSVSAYLREKALA
jgi:hypothetical protein